MGVGVRIFILLLKRELDKQDLLSLVSNMDVYQRRYVAHQAKKKEQLLQLYNERSSQRIFNSEPLPDRWLDLVLHAMSRTPSSCARYAVKIKPVSDRNTKQLLGGLLVGGTGWVHRADTILLLLADETAYKEGLDYMKYLDAGFAGMSIILTLESINVGGCYINPNVRKEHQHILREITGEYAYCGAIAVGNYDNKQEPSTQIDIKTLLCD
jgi:nitroreductase